MPIKAYLGYLRYKCTLKYEIGLNEACSVSEGHSRKDKV